jgi:hypothetical protein
LIPSKVEKVKKFLKKVLKFYSSVQGVKKPWIRIRVGEKCWIRIRIETYADPQYRTSRNHSKF